MLYVSGQIRRLIDILDGVDCSKANDEAVVEKLFSYICDSLHCSVLWANRIHNKDCGWGCVVCIKFLEGTPSSVVVKCLQGSAFADVHKAIREPLWQSGLFNIYGTGRNWVVMEHVYNSGDLDTIPTLDLTADLWMRIHKISTEPFKDIECIKHWDPCKELQWYFKCFYDISREHSTSIRGFFDSLEKNFSDVFSAIISPDPEDIVFCQAELYPRHTFFVQRGDSWECRVVDWDTAAIGPRWHDLTFYLRVDFELNRTLLPLYINMLSKDISREFDEVMGIYYQYRFLRLLVHLPAYGVVDCFTNEAIARYRSWLNL